MSARRVRLTAIALGCLVAVAASARAPATTPDAQTGEPPIIVTPPPTEAERHRALRDFTRTVIRAPRMHQPVAKFAFPVCVEVLGLAPDDAEVIAARIRENAETLGVGADRKPGCVPTIRVAFMAPAAGPASGWLAPDSPQLAHLPPEQRKRVLAETGPARAWNRVAVRDIDGRAFRPQLGDQARFPTFSEIQALSTSDPIVTTEITGAAVLIAREAAHGFTLGQLADYATMRALIGTGAVESGAPARTILTLFGDADPPAELTPFDKAMLRELYDASRNAKPRRVFNDIARAAVAEDRSDGRGN